ncbi:hypothetical protein Tsubulata_018087, partial [Turnera subulata]
MDMLPASLSNNTVSISNCMRLISSCKNLSSLLQVHAHLIASGVQNHHLTNTHLLKSYLSFQECNFARFVFDSMQNPSTTFNRISHRDTVAWNTMINGHAQVGNPCCAIEMFRTLCLSKTRPDSGTMVGLLSACALLGDLDQ